MPIEDVFTLVGRGNVVTGKIENGSISIGDEVEVITRSGNHIKSKVTGIEKFGRLLDTANEGDHAGLLLRGVCLADLEREYPGDSNFASAYISRQ